MKTVAFLTSAEGIEESEFEQPWHAVQEAGHRAVLVADTEDGEIQTYHHLDKADRFDVDAPLDKADPVDFDALVLPGGVANGDELRLEPSAVEFVKEVGEHGAPIASICHGGWVLIEAGLVNGRRMTSWPSLQTDYRNAGAQWSDEELVVDDQTAPLLISSRKPDDLPAFCDALTKALA